MSQTGRHLDGPGDTKGQPDGLAQKVGGGWKEPSQEPVRWGKRTDEKQVPHRVGGQGRQDMVIRRGRQGSNGKAMSDTRTRWIEQVYKDTYC